MCKAGYCITYDQAITISGTHLRENWHSLKKEIHIHMFSEALYLIEKREKEKEINQNVHQ